LTSPHPGPYVPEQHRGRVRIRQQGKLGVLGCYPTIYEESGRCGKDSKRQKKDAPAMGAGRKKSEQRGRSAPVPEGKEKLRCLQEDPLWGGWGRKAKSKHQGRHRARVENENRPGTTLSEAGTSWGKIGYEIEISGGRGTKDSCAERIRSLQKHTKKTLPGLAENKRNGGLKTGLQSYIRRGQGTRRGRTRWLRSRGAGSGGQGFF